MIRINLKGIALLMTICPSLWFSTSGCVNTKRVSYFNEVTASTVTDNTPIPESVIQKNDLLSITVSDINPDATTIFNIPNVTNATITSPTTGNIGGMMNPVSGYLVSSDGSIDFPYLGSITAAGLTKDQLKQNIHKRLIDRKLLVEPIVNVRYLNFRVTVLGEVQNPTVVSVPNEKISLLEALGMAGDLTIYGNRENVLVIREENGNKTYKRINLNSSELLSSPYYYLRSNDVVYVEPNKIKVATSGRSQQWLPIILGALSLGVIVLDRAL